MATKRSVRLADHFGGLTDPRRRKVVYPLVNIVTIAICAVICGADDFVSIAAFGRKKKRWLGTFLDLSAGIPSHDRFNAVLAALQPAEFEACLLSWIGALQEALPGQIVAIDGKTLRRSFDAASGKSAIHLVSAWATANRLSLGQVFAGWAMDHSFLPPNGGGWRCYLNCVAIVWSFPLGAAALASLPAFCRWVTRIITV